MLLSEAVQLIKYRLGNYTSTALDAAIIAEMNQIQRTTLEGGKFQPWFLLTESATAVNVANDERLAVPSDFIIEWEEGCLSYREVGDTDWTSLEKEDYDFLKGRYDTSSTPQGYAEAGDYFLIVPTPEVVYEWKMRYFAHQPPHVDDDDDESMWLKYASDWLIAETGLIIANNYTHNKVAAEGFVILAKAGKARVMELNVAKAEANRERLMGE